MKFNFTSQLITDPVESGKNILVAYGGNQMRTGQLHTTVVATEVCTTQKEPIQNLLYVYKK